MGVISIGKMRWHNVGAETRRTVARLQIKVVNVGPLAFIIYDESG